MLNSQFVLFIKCGVVLKVCLLTAHFMSASQIVLMLKSLKTATYQTDSKLA